MNYHSVLYKKLNLYGRLARVFNPIGYYLLLWPTLMALWIAGEGRPPFWIVSIFVLGVLLMRSAGCVVNDLADRKFDGLVARTRERPLAASEVSPKEAKILFAVLVSIAFLLVIQLNSLTIKLSFLALSLAIIYPFMKRVTHFPQVVLGLAFAFSIPMAFAAIRMEVPLFAWLLFGATACWVIAYDTEYAMVDKEDDIPINVKSTAIFFKDHANIFIACCQILALLQWLILGFILEFGIYYFSSLFFVSFLCVYQQHLLKSQDNQSWFQAFLNNNLLGAFLFLGLFLEYL